ncbi:MAG: CocE/NonD family hydrolase, partial [Polyangia bacterium]|nr:CocE/NonD family hydrolase [Polyangia bacterium]
MNPIVLISKVRLLVLAAMLAAVPAACHDETSGSHRESQSFKVRGTVEQVYVWSAEPGTRLELVAPGGTVDSSGVADYMGSLVFRQLMPGEGYQVRLADDPKDFTGPITVLSVEGSQPDDAFYVSQELVAGYQYITMRDGVTLAAFVTLPGPPEEGPYPTIVNVSGYTPGRPGESLGPEVEVFCDELPVLCDAPSYPEGIMAGMRGYAGVGVNIRGTGCSGGAYDYFETLQLLDGYDIVEIVSRQSWVKHNKVAVVGLSYPGITSLFIGKMRPPGLAAIAPMSVIADTATSCLMPGGIYNNGFAFEWITMVVDNADPYAHNYITELVEAGDTICEENQLLHSQKVNGVVKALEEPYYTDEVALPLDPSAWVDRIDVPVYLTGQWGDEQTGPHFAALLDKFTGAPVTRFVVSNGVHIDGYAPQMLEELWIFLDLYLNRVVPRLDSNFRTLGPTFMENVFGARLTFDEGRFAGHTDYDEALADYEAEDNLMVIFESGASTGSATGAPEGTFDETFEAWPIPGTEARRWYFQPDGTLGDDPPGAAGGGSSFVHDPDAGERVTLPPGASVNDLLQVYDYRPLQEGMVVVFETEPLDATLVMIGSGSVDLYLHSTASDADLEVSLIEVRPDGKETRVQCGWLRASHRALRDDATELRPVKTHREEDVAPLVADQWNLARVEIMPFAHIFRPGSRIRVAIDTPGDSHPTWRFLLLDHGGGAQPVHSVAHQAAYPSSVVLPVIPGIAV